jgi:type II secretory pathway pseudopilin PulG
VSDVPHGPGWWQASDGRWYPPEARPPDARPPGDVVPSGPPLGAPAPTAGKATATLVLAILSFVICPVVAAIAALVVAAQAKRQIDESYGALGGDGLVKAGRIIAIVNIVLNVVMVPVMLAIAIPTFLGAQERAQDRAAQADLRNVLTAEKVHFIDNQAWTDDPAVLSSIEPSVTYEPSDVPLREDVVYVVVEDQIVGLAAKSASGTCFYLSSFAETSSEAYAEDEDCGAIQEQNYVNSW